MTSKSEERERGEDWGDILRRYKDSRKEGETERRKRTRSSSGRSKRKEEMGLKKEGSEASLPRIKHKKIKIKRGQFQGK